MPNRISILIVDDEESVRDSLYNWFIDDGYRVECAENAKKALSLLNENEYACCLGFYSHACGVPWDALDDVGGPGNLPNDIVVPLLNDEEPEIESEFAVRCMEINDDPDIPKKEREKAIKKMFKEKGVKVKFVGRYEK